MMDTAKKEKTYEEKVHAKYLELAEAMRKTLTHLREDIGRSIDHLRDAETNDEISRVCMKYYEGLIQMHFDGNFVNIVTQKLHEIENQ